MGKFNPLLAKAKEMGLLIDAVSKVSCPAVFWCNEWYDGTTGIVIQDGNTCCFLHKIGLPKRFGKRHPLYSWQLDFLKELNTKKRKFFILKPPKIGATYLLLYWALHQALINHTWQNGQVAIVVGTTGLNEANKMIERAKSLIAIKDGTGNLLLDENGNVQHHFPLTLYNTKTEFTINTVNFRAFPAANNHIDSIRSQPNMKLIIGDEVAFFTAVDQNKIRDAFEHYSLGGDAKVVLLTTAGSNPQGFAYEIWQEEPSTYHKTVLDYHAGLEVHPESHTSLYDPTEINTERKQRSFKRNYMHIWGFGEGSIFDSDTLEEITEEYELESISEYNNGLFIDPAYGEVRTKTSSKFGMIVMYKKNDMLYVRDAIELDQSSDEQANKKIRETIQRYGIRLLGVDSSAPQIANTFSGEIKIKRFTFGDIGLAMTDNASDTVSNRQVRIHPKFSLLIEELRGAIRGNNGQVDKNKIRYDLGDCFNMGCYHFKKSGITIIEDSGNSSMDNPFEL